MHVVKSENLVIGEFIEECKTRFLAKVKIHEDEILCHVPSSCKLSRFFYMKGKTVLLQPCNNIKGKTSYSVYAIKLGRSYTLLNLSKANNIVMLQLSRRLFYYLGKRRKVLAEKIIDGYKTDLYIDDTKTIIEIKTLLEFNTVTTFPAMNSQRAILQLKKIKFLLQKGYKVYYFFVALNSKIKEVALTENNKEYYQAFTECLQEGMICKGYGITYRGNKNWTISRSLVVRFAN